MKTYKKKELGLTYRAKKNAISGILLFIVNTLVSFIINPILVQYLGTTHFGIWKSIDKFLGFASMLDGKGTQALKWTIAHQEEITDYHKRRRSISNAIVTWIVFLPLLVVFIISIVSFVPDLMKNLTEDDILLAKTVVSLLGINLILVPLLTIPNSVLVGTNRGAIVNYVAMVWLCINAIIIYILLYLNYGIKELALLILVITIMKSIHNFVLAKKNIKWFGIEKPIKTELMSFFKFSSWKMLWTFIAMSFQSSEIILLSFFIGPIVVSKYVFTSYAAITGITIAAIVTSALSPGLGRLIGNKEYLKSQYIIFTLRELIMSLGVLIGFFVLSLNKSFVTVWAGENLFLGNQINLIIVLIMLQLMIIRNEAFLIDLNLKIKLKVLLGFASVVLSLLFAVSGYLYIDKSIKIILIGILVGRLPLLIIYPILTNNMIENKRKIVLKIKQFIHIIILFSIAFYIGEIQTFDTVGKFIFYGSIEIFVGIAYLYYFFLTNETKEVLKTKVFKGIKI